MVEIGGGHGVLVEECAKNYKFDHWEIFEPNPTIKNIPGLSYRREFFSKSTPPEQQPNCIIHSHFFEHLYDPVEFLETVHSHLPEDGLMIFSVPNMQAMLSKGYVNSLNIEHTIYLPDYLVDNLLAKYGFRVIRKEYFMDDHSIFYACEKTDPDRNVDLGLARRCEEEFLAYIKSKEAEISQLQKLLSHHAGKPYFLFGAHIFSQHLIYNSLARENAVGILDNDPAKQGQRLYGSHLQVSSPETIANYDEPTVILRAGVYNHEIEQQLRAINPAVRTI